MYPPPAPRGDCFALRKWKQLSRFQRNAILFLLAFLMLCGLLTYVSTSDQWPAENRSAEGQRMRPANPPVLPAPQKADAHPETFPGLSPQKLPRHFRRGPPNLQIRAPDRTFKDRGQDEAERRAEAVDKKGQRTISWRGAVMEPEQGSELPSRKAEGPPRPSPQALGIQNPPASPKERQKAVIDAFRHAWAGYRKFAWGHDELRPVSRSFSEWFGLGLTLIDALDTMWILGLKKGRSQTKLTLVGELTHGRFPSAKMVEREGGSRAGSSLARASGPLFVLDAAVQLPNLHAARAPSAICGQEMRRGDQGRRRRGVLPDCFSHAMFAQPGTLRYGRPPRPARRTICERQRAAYHGHCYQYEPAAPTTQPARNETVDELFHLYRTSTGRRKYPDWGWESNRASLNTYTRIPSGGYSSISNVQDPSNPQPRDKMESFFLGETLKYLYLLFSDDPNLLSLDTYVFNTEAHPLPIWAPA
nr:LOW QUALITY PROTEIN: endoplasmic reticulum mannosyl-oligosaccharide 1,2-alpha-mannosidase-like [Camelus dromedarius]